MDQGEPSLSAMGPNPQIKIVEKTSLQFNLALPAGFLGLSNLILILQSVLASVLPRLSLVTMKARLWQLHS
jgi:hypothetical protein